MNIFGISSFNSRINFGKQGLVNLTSDSGKHNPELKSITQRSLIDTTEINTGVPNDDCLFAIIKTPIDLSSIKNCPKILDIPIEKTLQVGDWPVPPDRRIGDVPIPDDRKVGDWPVPPDRRIGDVPIPKEKRVTCLDLKV